MAAADLQPVPEEWGRALAVVAHPDDMEYGAASAVARWTSQGKDIRYLLVTRGEAGIDTLAPAEAIAARASEQVESGAAVGVHVLEYLDHRDGLVVNDLKLRQNLAGAIRRHRPEVLIAANFRDSWGGPSWNHADHRAVGVALLDAARDAANRWLFTEVGEPWSGLQFAIFSGSPQSGHGVDITGHLHAGIASLAYHRLYLENLGGAGDDLGGPDPDAILRGAAEATGPRLGVEHAVAFELIHV